MRRELEWIEIPGEHEARERAWRVVSAAFAAREPVPRPRSWKAAAALASGVVLVAGLLSPPGRAVLDELREVVGVEGAQPALFSLPARGRLLVTSEAGVWTVDPGGSKRLLGRYHEGGWSPFGRYVVAVRRNELAALEPDGDVRWTLARPRVGLPRWGGSRADTRIAYLSGSSLRVVGGDGRADRLIAEDVAPIQPAWRPGTRHVVTFVSSGRAVLVEADSGRIVVRFPVPLDTRSIEWTRDGRLLLVQANRSLRLHGPDGSVRFDLLGREAAPIEKAALSPSGASLAFVQTVAGHSHLWVISRLRPDGSAARRVFSGAGRFTDLVWSPDGRWLLVAWREADQWVFVRSARVRGLEAVSGISAQFGGGVTRTGGWCCGG